MEIEFLDECLVTFFIIIEKSGVLLELLSAFFNYLIFFEQEEKILRSQLVESIERSVAGDQGDRQLLIDEVGKFYYSLCSFLMALGP